MASGLMRFATVALVAAASAFGSAEVVVRLADRHPDALHAAAAQVALAIPGGREPAPAQGGAVMKASDGHYWAQGQVNGAQVRFLVDTGATAVALRPEDAQRLGFDLKRLHYGYSVMTAAGPARAAAVRLASVSIAGATLPDVDALVIEKGLDASLLGMSYLGRLSSFQATREALFLRP